MRMLRLSGLDADDMTDDQRDAFVNMAENLGIEPGDAEDFVDLYLEEIEKQTAPGSVETCHCRGSESARRFPNGAAAAHPVAPKIPTPIDVAAERAKFPNFTSSIGTDLLLVPSGVFQMGSEAPDAAPNERPITPVTLSRFYLSRHPITNAEYELFDPSHAGKRAPGAGDRHPVVYVSSNEAAKFCQWLSSRDRRSYRLADRSRMGVCGARNGWPRISLGRGRSGGAIWRISPIATLSLPGAIARSTMASRKARQSERFRAAPVPSEWKTWRGMSGNGAATSWKPTAALPKSTREDRLRARNGSIEAGAGSRASTACGRRRVAPMCQTTPATISVSGLFASAICRRFVAGNAE